jgi:hypothetical protein
MRVVLCLPVCNTGRGDYNPPAAAAASGDYRESPYLPDLRSAHDLRHSRGISRLGR